ncbi:MarR family transcriptional regulator [Acinetobacter sp. MD2]|uniref:MarR family winged helix-turn-helix transcriptional regulator n=1 Tax=Acinetobacter sp. MD2 TaxID=2600066 RepID=UPI002D1EDF8F|nr:MarR family transcriptional regulator [Acinetobacter sp. MD2]MEB3766224.1 MarR family transcriptional regulator [Acinetobacter sp. MD2]
MHQLQDDQVDKIIAQWIALGYAEQELLAMATIGRIKRVEVHLLKKLEQNYKKFDLLFWEFDVLATLKRSNAAITPTLLFKDMMVTSGTMTNRLQQLEKRNLIERVIDPNDKRSLMVKLSPKGEKIINECVPAHIELENQLLSRLAPNEVETLNQLLKKLEHTLA